MKHRKEVPLTEVIAAIDAFIFRAKSMQAFLRGKRVPVGHIERAAWERKTRELRIERLHYEWVRQQLSCLRYGPKAVQAMDLYRLLKTA